MKAHINNLSIFTYLFISLLTFSSFAIAGGSAQFCKSTGSGDWSNAATWSDCFGMYPGAADNIGVTWNVTIQAEHVITLNLETLQIHGLNMEANSELVVGNTFNTVTINNSLSAWNSQLGQITLNTGEFIINTESLGLTMGLVDGVPDMTINTTGTTTFTQAIGSVTPLKTISIGDLIVNADITTVNNQDYSGVISMADHVNFISQMGNVNFTSPLDAGGFQFGVYTADDFTINTLVISNAEKININSDGFILLNGDHSVDTLLLLQSPFKVMQDSTLTLKNTVMFGDLILNNSDLTLNLNQSSSSLNATKDVLAENSGGLLTKTGAGRLTLKIGKTVNVPIELLNGTLSSDATHTETITAWNDSTLTGRFILNNLLRLDNQSLFNVGNTNSVTGITTVNDLDMVLGSDTTMEFFLNGLAAGTFHDQLVVTNSINLSGNIVATHPFYALSIGDSFTLIDNQSGNPINGTFTGLPEGKTINNGSLTISYVGGDGGNDLVLTSTCLAQITVTSNADSGANTLRQAVADVCDGGTIDFDPSVTTINFASLIEIDKAITINGDGQILDGGNSTIIFKVTNSGNLTANRLNINNAFGDGAIQNLNILKIDEFNFNNNTQSNMSPGGGGALLNANQATVTNSTFYQNNANIGGAIFNDTGSSIVIRNSSFYENGQMTLISGGSIFNNGNMQIENSTLIDSGREGIDGATIHNYINGNLTLENTVIQSSIVTQACLKNFNSSLTVINSFIDDGSCGATLSGDADLGPWAAEGGFGNTFTPNVQSPLINAGDNGECPAFDPLGTPRPFAGQCDIGAVEFSQYRVGVNVTGLANGNQIEFQNNGADNIIVDDSSDKYFSIAFDAFSNYEASIKTQPTTPDQICKFSNNNTSIGGTIVNTDVILDVDCSKNLIYVNASAPAMGDGLNWASAYNNLQDALADPNVGEIWVASGVYYPDVGGSQVDNDKFSSFTLIDGVSVYGGFNGTESALDQRDPDINVTILSGDIDGDDLNSDGNHIAESTDDIQGINAYQIVNGTAVTPAITLLDGFTITAGHASDIVDLTYSRGAGLYCDFGGNGPRLEQMIFIGNKASRSGGATFGCASYVANSSYINNYSDDAAGAIAVFQGGYLINVSFQGNTAKNIGGAIKNNANNIFLTNVEFVANSTTHSHGGAVNTTGNIDMINTLFLGNKAGAQGGGLYLDSSVLMAAVNVTMTGNKAIAIGGAIGGTNDVNIQITNTIIWNNMDSSGQDTASASIGSTINPLSIGRVYSLTQGFGESGTANLDEDPLFITDADPTIAPTLLGDAHLMDVSIAINAGDNSILTPGIKDLDDRKRIVNGVVDMGVYEYFDEQVFKNGFE